MASPRVIEAPPAGKKQEVYIQANETVKLDFDVKNVKVDILGSDIVFTFKDGAQLIMTNLAVIMFSENAPHLQIGDQQITADQLLSEIGVVQSVSGKDAALLTSMEVDKNSRDPENQDVKDNQVVMKMRDNPPIIIQPPPTLETSNSHFSQGDKAEVQIKKTLDEMLISRTREIEVNTNIGKYTNPPADVNPPRIQALAPINGGGAFELGAPLVFSAKLLQLPASVLLDNNTNQLTFNGGTGSSSAVLDPSFLTQTQREIIDLTRHNGHADIYAETTTLIGTNLLSRRVEIQPALPVGYELGSMSIAGLPAGYTLRGLTPDGSGTYNLTGAELTPGTGPQRFILQYDPTALGAAADLDGDGLAHEYAMFDVVIKTTMFDLDVGGFIADEHTIKVIVKDTTQTDFSYVTDGWVLDIKPNENIILAGDGGVNVFGSFVLDRVATGTGDDNVSTYGGNDNISTSSGNDTIDPGTGDNIIDGGDGNDTLSYAGRSEDINIDLGSAQNGFGEITSFVGPTQEDQVKGIENVTTGDGDDTLQGDNNANILNGGAGDDFLMGRGGNDTINGGAGGNDTVSYTYAANGVTIDLQAGTGLIATGDTDTILNTENIIGSSFDDSLLGNASTNNLNGGDGDDLLNGRTGDDVLDGGNGINTVSFANQTSGVSLTLQNAGDSTATTAADTITLRNILNLIGSSFADTLTGNNLDNTISGGSGNDTLDGAGGTGDILSYADQSNGVTADLGAGTATKSGGSDTFVNFERFLGTAQNDVILGGALINDIDGGAGTDTLSYQNIGTTVVVDIAAGTTTGALTQTFTNIENVTGGTNNDTLTGDAGDNVLTGGAGNDILNANGGNDTLDGGANTDTATFVSYAESINVNLGAATLQVQDFDGATSTLISIETLVGTGFDDTFNSGGVSRTISLDGGAGTDTVDFSTESAAVTADLTATATGNFGTYTFIGSRIENIVGGSGNDSLTGTAGNNVMTGGAGGDTFNPNGGSDTLIGGLGTDTVTYASYGAAVTVDLLTLAITDAAAGVTTLNSIETIIATGFADTFRSGASIVDTTLNGGGGTDTIDFTQLQSAVIANLATGNARTNGGSFNYTLVNIENLTGGNGDDQLTGSSGNNIIIGGSGNDHFTYSDGTDTLDGGANYDYYNYLSQSGSASTINLGAANITITDAGTQNTTLTNFEWIGGTNNADTFNSGATSRSLTIYGAGGTDLMSFATETTAVTANLTSQATGAFGTYAFWYDRSIENLTGGSGNDTLTGTGYDIYSNGNNVIIGGDGDDVIDGNGGSDTITGGNGTDTATFANVTGNIAVGINATTTVGYTDASVKASNSTLATIETIITGSGNDLFTVNGGNLTLILNAGTGTDTIDFSAQSAAITADLNAVATGAFGSYTFLSTSFENILSGTGNDTLTGTGVANIIFAGNGTDTVNAGGGDDIIDDSNITFATNNTNIINGEGGNDTIFAYIGGNTIDGGTGTDTLRYDTSSVNMGYNTNVGIGHNTSANLTFTLNAGSTAGTVTDGVRTDTFISFDTYYGSTGDDTFIGGSGNDTFFGNDGTDIFRGGAGNDVFSGGNGIDTADYTNAAAGVTASLVGGSATNDGDGGTDTYTSIENITGSGFDDTLTGNSSNNVLNGGLGNDRIIGTAGADTVNGGGDVLDILDFISQSAVMTFDMNVNSAKIGAAASVTSYLNIEVINSGTGNDIVNATPGNLFANTIQYNLGTGANDSIVLSNGTVGTDATSFASRFDGVEYLNFLAANSAGGNMVFDGSDVFDMTTGTHALRLDINAGFGLTVQGGGYTLNTGPTVGGVTTYSFLTGATTMATLEVHVI